MFSSKILFLQEKTMKKLFYFILFGFTFLLLPKFNLQAQTELDDRAYLNFEEGIGFISADSTLGLNMRFRMQNRIGVSFEDGFDDPDFDMDVRRARLRFDGFINNQRLTYLMQLSLSRRDLDWDNSREPNILHDAMIFYKVHDNFSLGFGQGKLPGNRQRVTSSGALQFADRSIVNGIFTIDRDFGIFGNYENKIGRNFHYEVKAAISSGEGRNRIITDKGLAYTFKVELLPLGRFKNNGDYFEGDLEREVTPKVSLTAAYSFNNKATRLQGQRGATLFEQRDIESIFVNFLVKYSGFALTSELAQRNVDNPFVYNSDNDMQFIYTGWGINNQISYLFLNNFEIAGRYTHVSPSSQLYSLGLPVQNVVALGFTQYIKRHKTKIQLNLSKHLENKPLNTNDSNTWGAMVQFEIGI